MRKDVATVLNVTLAMCFCYFTEGNARPNSHYKKNVTTNSTGEVQTMKKVQLYIKPTCPYCRKVLTALEQLGKEVEIKDISADEALRDELLRIGGKKQVPCMVIDGKPTYESSDIVEWLIAHKNQY